MRFIISGAVFAPGLVLVASALDFSPQLAIGIVLIALSFVVLFTWSDGGQRS